MKRLLFLSLLVFALCGCSGSAIKIPTAQLDAPGTTEAPLDTLAAYRKKPGGKKTVQVRGFYRTDSTYVKAHRRTPRGS